MGPAGLRTTLARAAAVAALSIPLAAAGCSSAEPAPQNEVEPSAGPTSAADEEFLEAVRDRTDLSDEELLRTAQDFCYQVQLAEVGSRRELRLYLKLFLARMEEAGVSFEAAVTLFAESVNHYCPELNRFKRRLQV